MTGPSHWTVLFDGPPVARVARLAAHYASPLAVLRAILRADLITRTPGADVVTVDCDLLPADQVTRLCANVTACPLVIGEDWQVAGVEGGRVTLVMGGAVAVAARVISADTRALPHPVAVIAYGGEEYTVPLDLDSEAGWYIAWDITPDLVLPERLGLMIEDGDLLESLRALIAGGVPAVRGTRRAWQTLREVA